MENLESAMEAACEDGTIPGAVLQAASKDGSFKYSKAFGSLTIGEEKEAKPLPVNAILRIASCTKLMVSIAAMQCVERGQINLDDDVAHLLPEVAKLEVLTGFDDQGKPILRKRQNTITLRRLLTHSSGLAYPQFNQQLRQYIDAMGDSTLGTGKTVMTRYASVPLIYEPGTAWMYGTSLDFAGKIVERLNGDISLEEFMKKNIWDPLGIKDITFWPAQREDMRGRMASMTQRNADGSLSLSTIMDTNPMEECAGGGGASASMPDYLKILQSLLADDEKLLKKETVKQMIAPHLEQGPRESLESSRGVMFKLFIGEYPDTLEVDYGLGSMVTMSDQPGWRGKGTLIWSGLPNLFWYVDKQNGLCGIFGTQVAPPGDLAIERLITLFEKTMQKRAKDSHSTN